MIEDLSIPPRKTTYAAYPDIDDSYYGGVAEFKVARKSVTRAVPNERAGAPNARHPRYLVVIFSFGVSIFLVGLLLLGISIIVGSEMSTGVSSVLLAVGSIAATLAILRGQDLDERVA